MCDTTLTPCFVLLFTPMATASAQTTPKIAEEARLAALAYHRQERRATVMVGGIDETSPATGADLASQNTGRSRRRLGMATSVGTSEAGEPGTHPSPRVSVTFSHKARARNRSSTPPPLSPPFPTYALQFNKTAGGLRRRTGRAVTMSPNMLAARRAAKEASAAKKARLAGRMNRRSKTIKSAPSVDPAPAFAMAAAKPEPEVEADPADSPTGASREVAEPDVANAVAGVDHGSPTAAVVEPAPESEQANSATNSDPDTASNETADGVTAGAGQGAGDTDSSGAATNTESPSNPDAEMAATDAAVVPPTKPGGGAVDGDGGEDDAVTDGVNASDGGDGDGDVATDGGGGDASA